MANQVKIYYLLFKKEAPVTKQLFSFFKFSVKVASTFFLHFSFEHIISTYVGVLC